MREAVYTLGPSWNSRGDYPYHFIDDRRGLFEIGRFDTADVLLPKWRRPSLSIYRRGEEADVYFCTAGYFFFGSRARDSLADVLGSAVEWLPSKVEELGELWILHPLHALKLGDGAEVHRNEVSKNITEISRYAFAPRKDRFPPAFFVEQALGSAARRGGFVYPTVHITDQAVRAMERYDICGIRGEKVFERRGEQEARPNAVGRRRNSGSPPRT